MSPSTHQLPRPTVSRSSTPRVIFLRPITKVRNRGVTNFGTLNPFDY